MSIISLKAILRVSQINRATEVEAELYGPGTTNQHLSVAKHDFEKVLQVAGHSTLIDLVVGDQSHKVIIKEIQRDPLKNQPIHIDFMVPDPKKPVTVDVALEAIGKSNAIANMGGMLEKNLNYLKITCLSDKLITSIKVDLSKLENLKSVIRVEDIDLPEGVVVKNNPRDVVYGIAASRKLKAVETKTEAPVKAKEKAKK